ncbi:hypothetical protein [Amycolatopsis sp.]|uniref:hypothetical protein n=1 Tax=Amycolatopsis sp. TaxID=37632 RepID=UPI002E0598AD|nr:hypothetical protein [Amycolatopsis sp.]
MSDPLTSWVRTIVPGLWSALIAWLISLGLPDAITSALSGLGTTVIVPIALGGIYAALRGLEPKMPPWLTVVLLGSNRPPSYAASGGGAPGGSAPAGAPTPAAAAESAPVR